MVVIRMLLPERKSSRFGLIERRHHETTRLVFAANLVIHRLSFLWNQTKIGFQEWRLERVVSRRELHFWSAGEKARRSGFARQAIEIVWSDGSNSCPFVKFVSLWLRLRPVVKYRARSSPSPLLNKQVK